MFKLVCLVGTVLVLQVKTEVQYNFFFNYLRVIITVECDPYKVKNSVIVSMINISVVDLKTMEVIVYSTVS